MTFKTVFELVGSFIKLASLEARLAKKSLPWIIGLFAFMIIVLAASWFTLLAIVFYYLSNLDLSLPIMLFIVLLINLTVLLIVMIMVSRLKRNLRFSATGKQLNRLIK